MGDRRRWLGLGAGAAAVVLVSALVGATSRQTGATLVGITSAGKDGELLVRLWSDGRCEYAWVMGAQPARLVEDWRELEAGR